MVRLAPPTTFLSVRTRGFLPSTRIYVRLLGPCFKTGRLDPFRQHPENIFPQSTPEHNQSVKERGGLYGPLVPPD